MVKQIKGTSRFFIHESGFCFKISQGKEIPIPINMIRGVPKVKIENKKISLVMLMIEHFGEIKNINFKYSFKIVNGKLPLKNIHIKEISDDATKDEINIFKYKCKEKASAQNCRVSHKSTITDVDVLNCLKRTNFKCFYCNVSLSPGRWHLDHVEPISKGGLNNFLNITPACKNCNLMKGAIPLDKFTFHIGMIYKNLNQHK